MHLSRLLAVFFLLSSIVRATDVPRLEAITIDGSLGDWSDRGFLIDNLASPNGESVAPSDFYTRAHVGWDALGFLVAVEVIDNVLTETPGILYSGDSIELFLARAVGSDDRVQIILSPGLNPASDGPRISYIDNRRQKNTPLVAEVARKAIAHGYLLEARIPWTALGWESAGTFGFQLIANDADSGPVRTKWSWHSGQQSSSDPKQLNPIRLAETASPPDRVAWRWRPLDAGRLVVVVTSNDTYLDAPVAITARETGRLVAQVSLLPDPAGPRTEFTLRTHGEDIALTLGEQSLGLIPLKSGARPSAAKINRADYSLTPAVFSGDTFPTPLLAKPAEIETLLGPVTLAARYFNAAQQEVATPSAPGRYGVVYEVKPFDGAPPVTRCQTLYKLPQAIDWRTTRPGFDAVSLPSALALPPDTVRNHQRDFNDLLNDAWRSQLATTADTAVVLAAIADDTTSNVVTARDNAWRRDQDWWYPLRKKLGLWSQYDHVVYTPENYDADPAKRWPLLLFLHGSGDGETREALHKWGPTRQIAQGRKFPFIVVAPRSPPGPAQWWYAPQLGELLDDIETKYRVDKDRIYVTGLSMGGYGTWRLASEFPNRFAAIAPFCGGWDETEAPRIAHIPAWAFHGDKDTTVPVGYTLKMVAALKAAGGNPRMTLYPGVGHNCWEEAYGGQEFYDWLLSQHRPAQKHGPQP